MPVRQLLIFPSTWECEQGFSALMAIKSKSRNRLTEPRHDFRCAVSKVCAPNGSACAEETVASITLNCIVCYLLVL